MLDQRFIEENRDAVAENCRQRKVNVDIDAVVAAIVARRERQGEMDAARQRQNEVARLVKQAKSQDERMPLIEEGKALKGRVADLETLAQEAATACAELVALVPNMTHPDAPLGQDDEDNAELRVWGKPTEFDFDPRDHVEIGRICDLLDFEGGATVAGSSFYFLKNELALVDMALTQFAMRALVDRGFTPMVTPDLARAEILAGTGYTPRGDETQIYSVAGTDLCLIATAEIPLGGRLYNKIVTADELPIRLAGFSHCFRTEAGAAGRASKGLYRVHQFSKVEMFAFTKPEDSEATLNEMLAVEEDIFQTLGVPYRIVDTCTGDLGGPAYRKYDLEAWMPGRGEGGSWGEVTSVSNCTDYQARRLRARFRREKGGKPEFLHTLNGTAIATSRAMIALLENYQEADGGVAIPDALKPLLPFDRIEPKV